MVALTSLIPTAPLPYLTTGLPGCGGRLKTAPEDFQVEEVPAYLPAGEGEHLYLWVEKRGLSTAAVAKCLAGRLGLPPHAVGYAGRKDAQALTRQWYSLHTPSQPEPEALGGEGWRVLEVSRHRNKLRPGHLRGNLFLVTVRGVDPAAPLAAMLGRVLSEGFPNYFGEQRLGLGLSNALAGRRWMRSGARARGALERLRFQTNAYQAALFNRVLGERLLRLAPLGGLLAGDLAVLHHNGASFPVTAEGLAEARRRAGLRELSASAPLFGTRVPLAEGEPGALERAVLAAEGLTAEDFRLGSQRLSPKGERRAVRAFPHGLAWKLEPADGGAHLILSFRLDGGVFATSLLREIMKNDALTVLPDDS
jgi:tRNA pseudouridine13 synthase